MLDNKAFLCDVCYHLRHNSRRGDTNDRDVCEYKGEAGDDVEPLDKQYKWCRTCRTKKLRLEFIRDGPRLEKCNACARRTRNASNQDRDPFGIPAPGSMPYSSSTLTPTSLGPTSSQWDPSSLPRGSYHRQRQHPDAAEHQRELNKALLTDPDPELVHDDEYDDS
jgi:hypothetical protein